MCARYSRHSDSQVLADFFQGAPVDATDVPPPSFNVSPTQQSLVVVDGPRRLEAMRWQAALLRPAAEDVLCSHPVSRAVNAVANNGLELIEPVAGPEFQSAQDVDAQRSLFGD